MTHEGIKFSIARHIDFHHIKQMSAEQYVHETYVIPKLNDMRTGHISYLDDEQKSVLNIARYSVLVKRKDYKLYRPSLSRLKAKYSESESKEPSPDQKILIDEEKAIRVKIQGISIRIAVIAEWHSLVLSIADYGEEEYRVRIFSKLFLQLDLGYLEFMEREIYYSLMICYLFHGIFSTEDFFHSFKDEKKRGLTFFYELLIQCDKLTRSIDDTNDKWIYQRKMKILSVMISTAVPFEIKEYPDNSDKIPYSLRDPRFYVRVSNCRSFSIGGIFKNDMMQENHHSYIPTIKSQIKLYEKSDNWKSTITEHEARNGIFRRYESQGKPLHT